MIIRFWLISAICVAVALGIFIGDFTNVAGGLDRDARSCTASPSPARRPCARCAGAASTSSSSTTTSTTPSVALAADARRRAARGARRRRRSTGSSRRAISCAPAPGVPETHAVIAAAQRARRRAASEIELAYRWEQDRARWPAADAGGHRHRRQDDHDPADRRDPARRRAAHRRRRQHRPPLVDAIDHRPRRVRRRVHELPAGVDADVPRRGAAWLNLAPDHLNWHASMATLRGGQGPHLRQPAADDDGDRVRRPIRS